jgi:hypothetical protein
MPSVHSPQGICYNEGSELLGEDMMRRDRIVLWIKGMLVVCGGLLLSGCPPTFVGPTQPSGYRVQWPEASQTLRLQSLPLTVRVSDAAGKPVEEVEVRFRIPDPWTTQARVDPPTVVTQNGQATTMFRARTAGQMAVEITVENLTDTISIVVLGDTPRF